MIRRKRFLSLLVSGAVGIGAVFAANGTASPLGIDLTNVPTANTKSDGYAPASKLSPQLRQIAVAQGSTSSRTRSALTSYYGYDNDVRNAAGEPQMLPTPTSPATEAHKTEPDKNTYLVLDGQNGADAELRLRHPLPLPGPRGRRRRGASDITRINLDADAAHRVTLLATLDSDGQPVADDRRLDLGSVRAAAPLHDREPRARRPTRRRWTTRRRSSTSRAPSAAAATRASRTTRAGNLWIVEDVGGTSEPGDSTAKQPNSFVYRFVPLQPGRPRARQAAGAAGARPERRADRLRRSQAALEQLPTSVAICTPTATRSTPRWVTIHDTAVDGDDAVRRQRARQGGKRRRRSSGPRTASSSPARGFSEFFFDETGDTNATSPENGVGGLAARRIMKLSSRARAPTPAR